MYKRIIEIIGLLIFIIGVSSADSECLWIPLILTATGMLLLRYTNK